MSDADVGGPLDDDGNVEVADVLLEHPGQTSALNVLTAWGEYSRCDLTVCEDIELVVGVVWLSNNAGICCLEGKTNRP
jgi:hypothetical protein